MDGGRFDKLTMAMAAGSSRRSVLKKVAVGTAAGLLARAGIESAAARQDDVEALGTRPDGSRCNRGSQCERGSRCCEGKNGNSRCRDTLNNRRRCGSCNNRCARGEICINGGCFSTCRGADAGVCDNDSCGFLCGCSKTADNNESVCSSKNRQCDKLRECNENADCRRGQACVDEGCCPDKPKVCVTACEPQTGADVELTKSGRPKFNGEDASRQP